MSELACEAHSNRGRKAQLPRVEGRGAEMRVVYPDARLEPRKCTRTRMDRRFCCCAPCRRLRRRKHRSRCSCWLCYADRMGAFIDEIGRRTAARKWLWFVTITFRTAEFPWAEGFPLEQSKPSPDFAHRFFAEMIRWLEEQLHTRVEYFVADQFGEINGRYHMHFGLSFPGLFEFRWKTLHQMLWDGSGAESRPILRRGAGYNVIEPWEKDAGFYIGRYIGRDASRCEWDFRPGGEKLTQKKSHPVGREVIVVSSAPNESSKEFRRTMRNWHR